ncbi:uncharacterized protein LOC103574919 isoform X2 [Microplitis demolitor]|uniref:uncharacterized protein LOC103574919 isoform X2 n=1 Tax=Microplitis demolitor TaxID=69319 RepID=UPI0004CCE8D9|nr:uncharacterized protein LOC103574919 isoform X2 [Microplitis demolitor]
MPSTGTSAKRIVILCRLFLFVNYLSNDSLYKYIFYTLIIISGCDCYKMSVTDTVEVDNFKIMEAIMKRDQRTTSHRVFNNYNNNNINNYYFYALDNLHRTFCRKFTRVYLSNQRNICSNSNNSNNVVNNNNNSKIEIGNSVDCDPIRHNFNWRFKKIIRPTTWLKFICLLLGLAGLLILFLIISVQGKPTPSMALHNQLTSPPKWINPCGEAAENSDGSIYMEQMKDEQLLATVVLQAKTALDHAQLFCDQYVKASFSSSMNSMHSSWKHYRYDWLPGFEEIPKQLGEKLSKEYLNKLEIDDALLNTYEYMQKFAVGLEQIAFDQKNNQLAFQTQFEETEHKLRSVLCELQVAMMERGVNQRPDVTRDTMSDEFRAMSSSDTYRNLRDWLIFRDYMNALEYIVQVFDHLKNNLESS